MDKTMSLIASLRKEIFEQLRTTRFLVLLIVLGIWGMGSPLLANFMPDLLKLVPGGDQFAGLIPPPGIKDAIEQYIKNISQFSILMAIFLSMGAVVQEKERGTAVMMLTKPLSRGSFIFAKFLALAISFLVCILVAGLLGYGYTTYLFEDPYFGIWMNMNLLLWVYSLFYVAVTLLASTLARSQAVTVGAAFGVLLVLSVVGSIPSLSAYLPAQLVGWGSDLFLVPENSYWPALAATVGIIVVCLLVAWLSFRRQEI
jgi:ABC-2 type transport system permease protein